MQKLRIDKTKVLLIACIIFILFICLMPIHYGCGYFRDELYFIALSKKLAFGYVDVPPLSPLLLAIVRSIFGTSIFSVHLLPAIMAALVMFLAYRMVKIFGGNFFAQFVTLIIITPLVISKGSLFTYTAFNFFIWNLLLYLLLKLIVSENKNYWIYFGIVAGLGILTKFTVLFLGFGIVCAMVTTTYRKHLKYPQFWFAGLIALLLASPYVMWNYYHGFPTLEFFSNYAHHKLIPLSLTSYVKDEIMSIPFIFMPVLFLGIYYFLIGKNGKRFRLLGIAFIIILIISRLMHTRLDLFSPYYPILIAGGAVLLEKILRNPKFIYLKAAYIGAIILFVLYALPNIKPVLPLNIYLKYFNQPTSSSEGWKIGVLKQEYADMFGWKELAEKVAKIYNSLPPDERAKTAIFAQNYGEAAAISFFGKKYGLPEPISGHNQYYIWGPGNYNNGPMIIVQNEPIEHYKKIFKYVKLADRTNNKYCMPYENNLPIWLCKKPKVDLKSTWPTTKNYR